MIRRLLKPISIFNKANEEDDISITHMVGDKLYCQKTISYREDFLFDRDNLVMLDGVMEALEDVSGLKTMEEISKEIGPYVNISPDNSIKQ